METWKKVWRDGIAPLLSDAHLQALAAMLRANDPRLLQGATCTPPPLLCVQDWPCEACCLLGVGGIVEHGGWGQAMVADVEVRFAELCYAADQAIGEPAGCRWLLNWFDETPRSEMIRELLPEVEREQARRLQQRILDRIGRNCEGVAEGKAALRNEPSF